MANFAEERRKSLVVVELAYYVCNIRIDSQAIELGLLVLENSVRVARNALAELYNNI